jgi:malate synthase
MPGPNQYHLRREEVTATAADLTNPSVPGSITEAGIRENISAALQYCANWAAGTGCVPINHLMEDAATAEIARIQVWHWVRHGASTDASKKITADWIDQILEEEAEKAKQTTAKGLDPAKVDLAKAYLSRHTKAQAPDEFLTSALMGDL